MQSFRRRAHGSEHFPWSRTACHPQKRRAIAARKTETKAVDCSVVKWIIALVPTWEFLVGLLRDTRQVTSCPFNGLHLGSADVSGLCLAPEHLGGCVLFDLAVSNTMLKRTSPVRLPHLCQWPGSGPHIPHRDPRKRLLTEQSVRAVVGVLLLVAMLLPLPASDARANHIDEYRAKATFLAAFPKFIEWPPDAFPSQQAPLLLGCFETFLSERPSRRSQGALRSVDE